MRKIKRFRTHSGTVCYHPVDADERTATVQYWLGVPAVAVAFLVICCVAAGIV